MVVKFFRLSRKAQLIHHRAKMGCNNGVGLECRVLEDGGDSKRDCWPFSDL